MNNKFFFYFKIIFILFMSLLCFSACNDDDEVNNEVNNEVNKNIGHIRIDNKSTKTAQEVYIRMYGLNDWGPNLLSGDENIPPSSKRDFTIAQCNNHFEVKVVSTQTLLGWETPDSLNVECGKISVFALTDSR